MVYDWNTSGKGENNENGSWHLSLNFGKSWFCHLLYAVSMYVCMYGFIILKTSGVKVLIDLLKIEIGQFLKMNYD